MKTNIVRSMLLAWLLAGIAVCMTIPFVSFETLIGIGAQPAFRAFAILSLGALFCFSIGPNCVEFWRVRRSRNECRKAYNMLYRYFNAYPLEGFETSACQHLQQNLQSELKRHCSQYPFERHHQVIKSYLRYGNKIEHARSVI